MDPFTRWEQRGLTFELYEAGAIILYVDQDPAWTQEFGSAPKGDLSHVEELLGPDETRAFRDRLESEVWARWHGNPSVEAAMSKHLTREQLIKHLPRAQRLLQDFEFNDNHRFAPKDDAEAMREYRRLAARGCCGSHEAEMIVDGRAYLFGFNWGH